MKTIKLLSKSTFIVLLIVTISCKDSNQKTESESAKTEVTQENKTTEKKVKTSTNVLCKVNGENWAYTEASGIISKDRKTEKRTAIITFKKKLEKGSETIQLWYNAETYELESTLLELKFPKKGGGLMTGMFKYHTEVKLNKPDSKVSGKIDLTDPSKASGNGELINMHIRFDKDELENADDAIASITEIKFSDIGYSDLDKAF